MPCYEKSDKKLERENDAGQFNFTLNAICSQPQALWSKLARDVHSKPYNRG